ncbi:GTP-dependent nucleic acid-binding protein EngD [Melioribacter roseus P3M-2]|uniref:GTP-dependent nucleic acid-binding protein EngD n=1 Tax=Melioribacter roseus (strain DSM 23840 / JCM 17771 / VKM B-2668 / P3M-2) TaxID=1191523 RepID=I6Z8V7_MELRP|nr:redox-regulated ATPase YchF [Melioribacter roseus]AFN75585.1 GTP-dependent nucleic acid-binding protein EngD [Melioribacter roseus P3M-2]
MQIGLVGLQFSGKTTLFNTLSKKESDPSLQKEEAAIEVVKIPDERLDKLTEIFQPKKKVNATIEVFDIPGLKMSDDNKVRITNAFLNNVRNNDALFYVIRAFKDESVPHPMGGVDPVRDIEFLETEFLLSDLAFLENRLEKLKKDVQKSKDEKLKKELPVIEKCYSHCEAERPLRTLELDENELKLLSGYQLLTLKPLAIALNFDENAIPKVEEETKKIVSSLKEKNNPVIPFFAKIELELSKLEPEDQKVFMADYGIKESALAKILRTSYEMLGLQSFFTVGEDECRAWTIKKNYTAQQAAGVIHTDFYNRFIRAEVVHYDDFIKYGSFNKCKESGAWRLEGKEYIVKDGDIISIRHN